MLRHLLRPLTLVLLFTPPATRAGSPLQILAGTTIPPNTTLKVEADARQHQLTSPTALTIDDQGRVLVTETHRFANGIEDNRKHLYWLLDDIASSTTADRRALHEKWREKLPLARLTGKSEIVRRLADTNGDGTLDESKIFADGFNDVLDGTAAGIFAHEGTTYLACIPKLLMLRDTNGDGTADERKTIEEGFGVRISLSGHDMNGFALGPDGRIYGTIGDRGFHLTTKEGRLLQYPNQGAVFRFEPDGTGFELFHTGLRNPKEIAFDSLGNPFTVDNNSDQGDAARIVYLVEGGDSGWEMEHQVMFSFHRQIGLKRLPPNRWMEEKIWHLPNPDQPAFIVPPTAHLTSGPSGLTYHPGTGFLESENDRFLICDYRGSAAMSGIWSFQMKPEGAGMKLADSRILLRGVAATDTEYSWDGRLFITDFGGGWKSHEEGRLLSLSASPQAWRAQDAASTAQIMREGLEHRSSAELANLLKHPDSRIRLRAQIALTRKPDALKRLSDATASSDFMTRVHGIWGLGILARRGAAPLPVTEFATVPSSKTRKDAEAKLITLLTDKSEEIRTQSLRSLADATTGGSSLPLGPLLADPSPRVRFFATILAGKRKMVGYYGPICDMLAENDNRDPILRHAGAFALQHICPDSSALRILNSHSSPAVRLAAVVALRRMKSPDLSDFLQDQDPTVAAEAIRAICDLDISGQRPAVATLLDQLETRSWPPFMLRRLLHNSFRIGDAENASRVLNFAANPRHPEPLRTEAFRLISSWPKPFPADQFTGHWRPLPPRDAAFLPSLITKALPNLLRQKDFALAEALRLIETYQINLATLDEPALRSFIANSALPDAARSKAIDLLTARKPADLTALLSSVIQDAPDAVALTALRHLVATSPESAITPLQVALESENRPLLAKKSWKLLASIPGSPADTLFIKHLDLLRAANGVSPHAIELIDAAKQRSTPPVTSALKSLEEALAASPDPLAKWNIALEGGNPLAGQALFTSHPAGECMRCHRAGQDHTTGGETAPNLLGIANRHSDRRYFLESIINPNAVIAPGFSTISIDFKNGASIAGKLLASTPEHFDLESDNQTTRIRRSDVASHTTPISAMPPMGDLLTPAEIRDLIAWLATLTENPKSLPASSPPSDPPILDPATLPVPETSTQSDIDPAVLKTGKTQYIVCAACHGQQGEGTPAGPPLAGSEWVNGPPENLIRIQLRGLQGPITVKGQTYDFPSGMAPLAYQTDEQIAAVLTYIRSSFGNSAPPVNPAEVAALRQEAGKPMLTAAELIPPTPEASPAPAKYADLRPASSTSRTLVTSLAALLIFTLLAFATRVFLRRKP